MSQDRRLAAIMFTDIVGYTSLMGKDEKKAFQLLEKNRNIHKPLIEKYHGTFLKEIGDAILASFPNVYDAVICAIQIIKATKKEHDLSLRIGVHEGEVVFKAGDVYGDGVNIAARIEGLAEAGGISISGTVYDQVENKLPLGYEYMGEKIVKNITRPLRVYKIQFDTDC